MTRANGPSNGAILRLAGPGQTIAVFMLCTVIERRDLADRFLDRKQNPEWRGERCKLLYQFPKNLDLWDQYATVRKSGIEKEDGGAAANAFYLANRAAMDEGAAPAWPARFEKGELSAVQNAMNLFLTDPAGFRAEYQNDPEDPDAAKLQVQITEKIILAKVIDGLTRGFAPRPSTRLTAMIDVQQALLYFLVVAWDEQFGGAVIDYGTFPEQPREFFTAVDAPHTLAIAFPELTDLTALIYKGLDGLCQQVLARPYRRLDAEDDLHIGKCLVDANWEEHRRRLPVLSAIAVQRDPCPQPRPRLQRQNAPMDALQPKPGEQVGKGYRIIPGTTARRGRHVTYDTNYYKSFVMSRLKTPLGAPGSLGIFAHPNSNHRLLVDHWTAEYATSTKNMQYERVIEEWSKRPGRDENHWFDCVAGSAVAAAILGLQWSPAAAAGLGAASSSPTISLRDMQRKKLNARGS